MLQLRCINRWCTVPVAPDPRLASLLVWNQCMLHATTSLHHHVVGGLLFSLCCITGWCTLLFSLTAKSSFASSRSLTALVSTMAPPLHHLCREHYIIFSTGHLAGHLRGTGKGFPFHSVKQTKRQSSWNILLGHILTDTNNHGSLILYINWGKIERELSQSAQSNISVGTWHLHSWKKVGT